MINYVDYQCYLQDLVTMYKETKSLRGMSKYAHKWHCKALTKDQFYLLRLNEVTPEQITLNTARRIRDDISSKTKLLPVTLTTEKKEETKKEGNKESETKEGFSLVTEDGRYRVGQILFHTGMYDTFLVSSVLPKNRITFNYKLGNPKYSKPIVVEQKECYSYWTENESVRIANDEEVKRFLDALTKSGYVWYEEGGLYYVQDKDVTEKHFVFDDDLPQYFERLVELPRIEGSPYRFALQSMSAIDNAEEYMMASRRYTETWNAIEAQIKNIYPDSDGVGEIREYDMPTLCCAEWLTEYRIAFVKTNNNGTSFWLGSDENVLRLLAWVSEFIPFQP